MRATTVFVLALLALLACGAQQVAASGEPSAAGEKSFHQAGFPTIALFTTLALIVGAVYLGLTRGEGDVKGSASVLGPAFLLANAINVVLGIFLLFGPGGGFLAAQVNVIGLQILVAAALGFYVAYTNARLHAKVLFGLIVVTIAGICGCFPWLNQNVALWSLSQSDCLAYFQVGQDPQDFSYNRCEDKGFLQLLRTFSMFALASLLVQAFQLLTALSDGEVLSSAGKGEGAGGVGGSSARASLLGGGFGESYAAPVPSASTSAAGGAAPSQSIAVPYSGPSDATTTQQVQSTSYQAL